MTSHDAPDRDGPTEPAPTLTAEELRVLACLVEKSHTTPDQYPLSTNALTTACNQKTSRDPVVDYPASLVDRTMQLLRDGGWARSIRGSGNRTFKHRHVIDERLGLDGPAQAVLAVLALRGPQSAGELKTRTERYHPFADPAEVETVLARLRDREPTLARNIGRAPGQSQDRWVQLLGPTGEPDAEPGGPAPSAATATVATGPVASPAAVVPPAGPSDTPLSTPTPPVGAPDPEVAALRERVTALEERLARLEGELGLEPG